MIELIKTLKERQTDVVQHKNIKLVDPHGIQRPIADWFDQEPIDFMGALSNKENNWIIPGRPDESPFVTDLLAPAGGMGDAFSGVIPNTGGKTGREIAIAWITNQCPLEATQPSTNGKLLNSSKLWLTSHSRLTPGAMISGQGTVH